MPESLENQSQIDRHPRETDAVLGGQAPPPVSAAVMGGIAGFKRHFASDKPEEIIAALQQARWYGKDGLELAVQSLKNPSWQVQYAACKFLHENAPELQKALQADNPYSDRSFAQFSAPSIGSYSYSYYSSIDGFTLSPNKQFIAIGLQARGHCPFVDHTGYATAVHLLDRNSGRTVKETKRESDDRSSREGKFVAFAFSADSQRLAIFQDSYSDIELWNTVNGELITRLSNHKYWARSLAISPDGQILAMADREIIRDSSAGWIGNWWNGRGPIPSINKIELRDSSAGTLLATLTGHSDMVYSLAISPDGRTLVSGSEDKTIKLWDLPSGKLRATLTGHEKAVTAVAVSPDGEAIASSSRDKTVKLWDVASGELIHSVTECSSEIESITITSEGLFLWRSHQTEIRLLDNLCNSRLDPMELLHRYLAFKEALNTSPENLDLVIEALKDNSLQIQHLAECFLASRLAEPRVRKAMAEYKPSYWQLFALTGHSDRVNSVAMSPDGQTLASGSDDKTVKLWDLPSRTLKATLTGHSQAVNSVAISPDGQTLASGSYDNTIMLWDLPTGTLKATLTGHSKAVTYLAISPDGQTLASSSYDETVKLWDLQGGTLQATFTELCSRVDRLAFSPDGQVLAAADKSDIILLDLPSGTKRASINTRYGDSVYGLAFSPDGQTIAAGSHKSNGGDIKLWDFASGEIKLTISTEREDSIYGLAFSPDGQVLAACTDQKIKLWNANTGELKAIFCGHSSSVNSLAMSSDGQTIASGSADCTVRVWYVPN